MTRLLPLAISKRIILLVASLALALFHYDALGGKLTGELHGKITDAKTANPLSGATINLPDLKVSATAGDDGTYSIQSIPNGHFNVVVSYVGYKSFAGEIIVKDETLQDFALTTSVVEFENVVVTGTSSSSQLRHSPVHMSVVSQRQLQNSAGTNLMDVISRQAGVSVVTTGPAIAKPFIRGLGYNRVVTINDGVRQEGQQWGDEHGIEIDEYSARKIEILRGPASLIYGSDALGGVINVITNTPVPNNTVQANVSGSLNANNNMQGGYANVAGNINGFNWNLYGSAKSAGDYSNKFDGHVLNTRFNEKNFGGFLGINKKWGYSHLLFTHFGQRIGMTEGERDKNGNFVIDGHLPDQHTKDSKELLDPRQRVRHFKVALDNVFIMQNGGRINFLASFQRNIRQEFEHNHDHDHEESSSAPAIELQLRTLNYNLAWNIPTFNDWKVAFGVNGMYQENTNRAEELLIPDYHLFDFGLYSYITKSFNKTRLSGGLRYDARDITGMEMTEEAALKFEAFKRTFSNISGSLGLTHDFNDNTIIKLNVSRGFRSPAVAELSANGSHEGTGRYEVGNLDLKNENSFSVDAGLDINTTHASVNLSPYFNHISNYIYFQKQLTGAGTDSLIADAIVYKFNQQTANLYGFEATVDIHPHPLDWLHFENSFGFVRGTFTEDIDGSSNLPLMAPARLLTELRVEFPLVLGILQNFTARLQMDNVANQNKFFSGFNTETRTAGYTVFNAGIGTDFMFHKKKWATLILALNNLSDVAYQSHLSRFKYSDENLLTGRRGIFNMGRNFTARLIIPLEWQLKKV